MDKMFAKICFRVVIMLHQSIRQQELKLIPHLSHIYNWVNFTYGKALKFGMYIGYLKNLGTVKNPITDSPFYGMTYASGIDMVYKISPQLIYNYKNFMFGIELSLTTVAYGSPDYSNKAKVVVNKNDQVSNFRNMISVAYYF